MKLIVLAQAKDSERRTLRLLARTHSVSYVRGLQRQVAGKLEWLKNNAFSGQLEPGLEELGLQHRRVIVGPFKIIYRITTERIIVTDIFDSRRDPKGMKG
ncbi:MAG: type II toxin-antitoxin system RelE/ParE family toxin [Flavobacteriales bacterium]|nr:type II toxin-antitoxin system RelE/ParE family toxin [Flavobacteriales bacterium]